MRLKEWLAKNNIKHGDLCKPLGANKSRISRIVNGRALPTLIQADKIYRITDGQVTLSDWF